jgi:hypothetical protein
MLWFCLEKDRKERNEEKGTRIKQPEKAEIAEETVKEKKRK